MKKYTIKETFYTVQGEGFHVGTFALFIRFAGCNMWSGRDETRKRDAKRNGAECPLWCDTDFVGGSKFTIGEWLDHLINELAPPDDLPLVVLTGGEPFLQLDHHFVATLRQLIPSATIAVETNGTVTPQVTVGTKSGVDWVCVSPKKPARDLKIVSANELKVVYPAYNPNDYDSIVRWFDHAYVSAEATTTSRGRSLISHDNLQRAAAFVMENPQWRLTLQSHKIIGVP